MIAPLTTLLGVIVGAVGSYAFSTMAERARWRRSLSVRWDDRRLTAYAEYANSVKLVFQIAMRIVAYKGFPATGEPLNPKEGIALLAQAEQDRATKWETVLLLGDPATIAAARHWHSAVWKLDWYARDLITRTEEFEAAVSAVNAARSAFYACVRSDLGVRGLLPQPEALEWAHPSKMPSRFAAMQADDIDAAESRS